MKLTTIVTFVAAIGAEVALASPVAQQAPVKPNPAPNCLPNGCYTSQAGLPGSACCSGYFANGCCRPRHHLAAKDDDPVDPKQLAPGPNPCDTPGLCESDDEPEPEPEPEPADPPPPPAPEPEPPKASLCFKAPPAGLGGLTAETIPCPTPVETKTKLCFDPTVTGIDKLTAKTIPCAGEATPPAGDGVVTQLDDGQVVAPVSATGNPVSLSTVGAKGAVDVGIPTLSPGTPIEQPSELDTTVPAPTTPPSSESSTLPAVTWSSTEPETSVPSPIPSIEPLFPNPIPSFLTGSFTPAETTAPAPGYSFETLFTDPILPTSTEPSTQLDTNVPLPGYSFETGFTDPILPTRSGPLTTYTRPCKNPLNCHPTGSHEPFPAETLVGPNPTIPGDPSHLPYPTGTFIGDWDPRMTDLSPEESTIADLPLPTTPSWTYEKRAWGMPGRALHHVQRIPTTLATVVVEERAVEEATSVHHVGPGWDHTIAWRPFPTGEDN
ncbi:MAG: hypothetical protein Q9205_006997 [Flavoplaca limonia]